MSDQKLSLTVQVNSDTGQLEVVGAKLGDLGEKAKRAGGGLRDLSRDAGDLVRSFLPFATGAGLAAFFVSAVKGAEEQNEAFRRLRFSIEATGQSWDNHKDSVEAWAASVESATRFAGGEAIEVLEKLTRVTGSVSQATRASELAMGLSVSSGKSLAETTGLVTDLINGNERALIALNREFGGLAGGAKSTQEALDTLVRKYGDAAFESNSLTDASKRLINAFGSIKDQIGNAFIPALTSVAEFTADAIGRFNQFGLVVAAEMAKAALAIEHFGKMIGKGILGGLSSAESDVGTFKARIDAINAETERQFIEMEQRKTNVIRLSAEERLTINAQAKARQDEKDLQDAEKKAEEKRQQGERLLMIENELEQRMLAINGQSLPNKLAMLRAEVAAREAKINQELKSEVAKQKALAKLRQYELQQEDALRKAEVQMKLDASLQIADLAVQTLSVINSMNEKGHKSEKARAIAILALEKGIAIARAIAEAQKGGPLAGGIAAANIALITAQFAMQAKAIDQASSAFASGQVSLSVSTPIGGGRELEQTFGPTGGGSVSPVIVGAGGGGGGGAATGGGGAVINVGGVTVNIDFDKLSSENTRVVMEQIAEAVRRGVNEGVQLAIVLRTAADRNSSLVG